MSFLHLILTTADRFSYPAESGSRHPQQTRGRLALACLTEVQKIPQKRIQIFCLYIDITVIQPNQTLNPLNFEEPHPPFSLKAEQFHVSLIQPANFLRANFQHSAGSAVARASSDRSGAASFRTCNADGISSKQCWQCVFERKGPVKQNPPSSSSTSWQHLYTYPNIGMRWLKIQKFILHVCCCIFVINRNRLW